MSPEEKIKVSKKMIDFSMEVWENNSSEGGTIHSYIFEISLDELVIKVRLDDEEYGKLKKVINNP